MSRKRTADAPLPKKRYYNKTESKGLIKLINVYITYTKHRMDTPGNAWMKDYYSAKLRRLEAQRAMLAFGCKVEKPILLQL